MQKPITIIREELKNNIVELINNSNLPAFIVGDVVEKILFECRKLEQQQYEQDKKTYEAQEEKRVEVE